MHINHNAFAAEGTYIAAFANAELRAMTSYFPQHIIRDEEGGFFAIDEGDYGALPTTIINRVVCSISGKLDDSY
ncbi:hypothetical protein [Sphingobium sp. EP60837]|uniref:hypothetical protein n=1 Tax=Sphingobium sp. EP60837 TaxID=1855519 RepID=UPI0007DDED27|nr:hypothetical protein [Sphingobium sp. EP60837]ANI80073.1 hypothetical protein EP837_03689 [Sphingobium sp. EP60837]